MSRYDRLRRAAQAADIDLTGGAPDLCEEAHALRVWAEDVCGGAIANGEIVALKQAKLRLTERYFARRSRVQRRHRSLSGRGDHVCMDEIFVAAFERLDEAEHDIRPPVIEVTRTIVAPSPRGRYDGILVGEVLDDEFE